MKQLISADERPRFLGDENFNEHIITGLRAKYPALDTLTFAESGLATGLTDPLLIEETARLDRILLTHDKRTMPGHFASVLARWLPAGRHMPGVLILRDDLPVALAIEQVALVWGASRAEEWRDRVVFLPE
jgi:hypothetical protein